MSRHKMGQANLPFCWTCYLGTNITNILPGVTGQSQVWHSSQRQRQKDAADLSAADLTYDGKVPLNTRAVDRKTPAWTKKYPNRVWLTDRNKMQDSLWYLLSSKCCLILTPLGVMVTPEANGHPTEKMVSIKMHTSDSEMINSNSAASEPQVC